MTINGLLGERPVLFGEANDPAARAAACRLLSEGSAELTRLRRVHGASRRTYRRMARAAAVMVAAAAFLGLGAVPSSAATPHFVPPPLSLVDVERAASPTFADIDGDGDLDAFIGNSYGDTFFFENTGTAAVPVFAPGVANPFGLADVGFQSMPAFADIDGDGDLDAFIGEWGGNTYFFENTGTALAPAFAPAVTNPFGLVDVGWSSAPALADIDGDGDLDVFIGELFGDTFFFENTGTASAPAFAPAVMNPFGLATVNYPSWPAFADIDGDGDLDAFTGAYHGDIIFFENTGSASVPAFAPAETNPFGFGIAGSVNAENFPTFADIDGDGDLDAFIGEEYGRIFFFENTGTASAPAFAPGNPVGLTNVDYYSSPVFADIDGDGDLDAFIGEWYGNTYFFENTGSASAPAFASAVMNPFGLADVGRGSAPTLADIDGDGDLDAFIGEAYGYTIFFENTGTALAPAFAPAVTNPFGLTDVYSYSVPTLADIDGDGDLDAFIGESYGDIVFFENTGTASAPAFAPAVTNPFGLAAVFYFNSPTFADIDGDGDLDAFIGEYYGDIIYFENTGTASAPAFAPAVTNPIGFADAGWRSAPAFADIDGDGDLDAFIGERSGKTFFFENVGSGGSPTPTGTPMIIPTATPTSTPTNTPTIAPTETPMIIPTATPTSTPTNTPTTMPTDTPTATPTIVLSATPTVTDGPTATPTPTPLCGAVPEPVCKGSTRSRKSVLLLEHGANSKEAIWRLRRGQETVLAEWGDPLGTTSYSLCVYDESSGTPDLVLAALVPAGGACFKGAPCWRGLSTRGYKYVDKDRSPGGVSRIVLRSGVEGRMAVVVKAAGENLNLPALPLNQDDQVIVQLVHSEGGCWGETFNQPAIRNNDRIFRDRKD